MRAVEVFLPYLLRLHCHGGLADIIIAEEVVPSGSGGGGCYDNLQV